MESEVLTAMIILGGLGLIFGTGLAIASRIFFIKRDPRIELVESVLPGVNC